MAKTRARSTGRTVAAPVAVAEVSNAAIAGTAESTTANCPHCGKPCHVSHAEGANSYSTKLHKAGHFCENCDMPLDMLALSNTNVNYGDETCRRNLVADLTAKIEAFQNSL